MHPVVSLVVRSTVWLILHGYADCANATLGPEIEAGVSMSIGRGVGGLLLSFMLCGGTRGTDCRLSSLRFFLLLYCHTAVRQLKWTSIFLSLVIPLVGCLAPTIYY